MKIAVYTIAKNEKQFVQRWAESCKDADYRIILDTGSTDNTVELARSFGVECQIQTFVPWRFDEARNACLALVPNDVDICIALDMDEILVDGWRSRLESIADTTTRPRYKYVWSWNDDGSEGLVYGGDKIHARHGYFWKHPVHEVITASIPEYQEWVNGLEIHHHPDNTKSRSQYLGLLELAINEDPNDDRNQFYLAREYFFNGMGDKAIIHFMRHLELSKWAPERAASYRYMARIDETNRELYLFKAVAEDSSRRESWVDLTMFYYEKNDWIPCLNAATMGLRIIEKPLDYLCEAYAWGPILHDIAAVASYNLGLYAQAFGHGCEAFKLGNDDSRLGLNLSIYKKMLNGADSMPMVGNEMTVY